MRVRVLLAGLVTAALAVILASGVAAHTGTHDNFDAGWLQKCGPSGSGTFDPIVYPRQNPAGHNHSFIGGAPRPDSTFEQLRAGATTCPQMAAPGDNKSLYWIESYFVNGTRVAFQQTNVYYKRGNVHDAHAIRPFPSGHKMIARKGVGHSLGQWFCAGDAEGSNNNFKSAPYKCPASGPYDFVAFRIAFPQCSDGRLDSADHMSHMAYAVNNQCPLTHPIAHPRIMLVFKYRTLRGDLMRQQDGTRIDSEHADAFSAWDPAAVQRLVETCIHTNRNCDDRAI